MKLSFYDSLSRELTEFIPIDERNIRIYACGPTVYDNIHLGNARAFVIYDVLYRLLTHIYGAANIKYVRNITDIDDKINKRAKELDISIQQLTSSTIQKFIGNTSYLNIFPPTAEPKATEYIAPMINLIRRLLDRGHAYQAGAAVYFAVKSFPDYLKISRRSYEEMRAGGRVHNDPNKSDQADFILWKPRSPEDDISAVFDSPWGQGRPGWHIECSAMSYELLGQDFDIHLGGADLIFPHHTNEIAQSQCAFPGSTYAKYWLHNGFITVDGEKMSKSLNNFITVEELATRSVPGEVIRWFLLSGYYRHPLDFNIQALHNAHSKLNYLYRSIKEHKLDLRQVELPIEFTSILCKDLNTPQALNFIYQLATQANKISDHEDKIILLSQVYKCANWLGLMMTEPAIWLRGEAIDSNDEQLIILRGQAKKQGQWQVADQIREQLKNRGVVLEDQADGTTSWYKTWS